MPIPAGTKLGPYEIQSQIGAGGMGEVYRARDSRLGREVAIKILPESFATDAERLRRFEQESQPAAARNHPTFSPSTTSARATVRRISSRNCSKAKVCGQSSKKA